jgi:hypothetical protein
MKQTAVGLLKQKLLNDQQKFPIYSEYINGVIDYLDNQILEMEKQQMINAFNQGERYGWDTQASIENIDEMRSKIPFISLEKYLEQFKKK